MVQADILSHAVEEWFVGIEPALGRLSGKEEDIFRVFFDKEHKFPDGAGDASGCDGEEAVLLFLPCPFVQCDVMG